MNKIKLWLTGGKNPLLILILLCFLMVVGLLLVWNNLWGMGIKEGLYVSVADNTVRGLDRVVDANILPRLNDVPNSGAPIVFTTNPPVAQKQIHDPEFPTIGSVLQCSLDDINGNGSYYMVSNTDPKTINLFPTEDPSIINSWTDTWGSAPSFKNCSGFVRGPTMERRIQIPDVGTDIKCRNEDSQPDRHTYRVMSRTRIQPFPGYQEDPYQLVAKSWGVNEDNLEIVDDCSKINKVLDDKRNVKKFKYKMSGLEGKLVKCLQSNLGSNPITPGNHGTDAVYKVEGGKLRWFQNKVYAYTSVQNIKSWELENSPVVDVPDCDDIELGENISYNGKNLPDGTYTKCAVDVKDGAGVGEIYRVFGNNGELSWTVSNELALFFDPNFKTNQDAYGYYPDCSSFKRVDDITKKMNFYRDYKTPGEYPLNIPPGCIGLRAIVVGAGGGGGGGGGTYYKRKSHDSGGGAGGGGGGGGVLYSKESYIPINDYNKGDSFSVVVGKGGQGGKKGDKNYTKTTLYVWEGDEFGLIIGNSESGTNGGDSYLYSQKNNIFITYFKAKGGRAGIRGKSAMHNRGENGNGGEGGETETSGTIGTTDSTGIPGSKGDEIPYSDDPYKDLPGGNGGISMNIPPEVQGKELFGIGGKGGTGSTNGHDQATAGANGSDGFVRIKFVF